MESHRYGMIIKTNATPADAEAAVRSALADQGFGILTEIDVAATMKAKLDVDRAPYRILGACNPTLANRALDIEESIGLLLPCNVAVYASETSTVIAAMEPELMSSVTDNDALAAVASEAKQRIEAALIETQKALAV